MYLLVAFIAVPILEIALFLQVGGLIGFWPTILIVIATAFLGTWLVRSQGAQALGELRASLEDIRDPTEPLAHGAMILVAGALLLTPGFFTDAVGFALLLPPVRRRAFTWLKSRIKVVDMAPGGSPRGGPARPDDRVIDAEYHDVTDNTDAPDAPRDPSGWTRH